MLLLNKMLDETTFRVLVIVGLAAFSSIVVQFLTKNFIKAISSAGISKKRLLTLSGLAKSAVSTLIFLVAFVMVLREAGFDITPLIASAGIIGLAVGFGSQALVKDVISGFFVLIENQFDEGDEIEISGKKGAVEKVTLRTVWLRDKDGALHIIPHGSITMVSNFSKRTS